jgi:hypothetical protein
LRDFAVVQLLVALVLDGNGQKRSVLVQSHRVGLPTDIAGAFDRLRGEIDDRQIARRLCLAFRGVDAGEDFAAGDDDGGRLALDLDDAAGNRIFRVGDVDEADRAQRAVGIDQHHAVLGGRDDFRRGRCGLVHVGGQIACDGEGGDAVEHHVGMSGQ